MSGCSDMVIDWSAASYAKQPLGADQWCCQEPLWEFSWLIRWM